MPNEEARVLTLSDKKNLEDELEYLKTVKRPQVTADIAEARAHGDLSENAEYTEAKNEEARVNGLIAEKEELLRTATFLDDSQITTDAVAVGTAVRVFDMEYEEEDTYTLVGFTEADPAKLYISSESPIGMALMGARVGDIVDAQTPGGVIKLKVLSIRKR